MGTAVTCLIHSTYTSVLPTYNKQQYNLDVLNRFKVIQLIWINMVYRLHFVFILMTSYRDTSKSGIVV